MAVLRILGEELDDIKNTSASRLVMLSVVPVPALLLSGLRTATLRDLMENNRKGHESWWPLRAQFFSPCSSGHFCRTQQEGYILYRFA